MPYADCPGCGWSNHSLHNNCYNCGLPINQGAAVMARTQKCRGIMALQKELGWSPNNVRAGVQDVKRIIQSLDFDGSKLYDFPYFARPCPVSPQHGFVESRVVKNLDELKVVVEETFAADPGGEVILTHPVDASMNVILTDGMMAIGPGHDGATSGKKSFCIPIGPTLNLSPKCRADAQITDAPYVEAVYNAWEAWTTITQLRNGPKLDNALSPNFIPEQVEVKKVIKTNGEDLLAWRDRCRAEIEPGTVVYHPGGTPLDHYSVHCRENGIPLVTTFKPEVGQVLEVEGKVEALDPEAMIRGLAVSDYVTLYGKKQKHHADDDDDEYEEANAMSQMALALLALHSSGVLRGPHSFWLGYAAGVVLMMGSAAMRVEARHANKANVTKTIQNKPQGYQFYCNQPMSFHRAALSRVSQCLLYGFGDPHASKSFGGKNWALCGAALAPMFNTVHDLVVDPTPQRAADVITTLNIAINQAHNGGWWLNKFIDVSAYNNVPSGHIHYLLAAAPAIWRVHKVAGKANVETFKERVKRWPETTIAPLKWRRMNIDVGPGSFKVVLHASSVPQPIEVNIPITPEMMKTLVGKVGKIKVEPGRVVLSHHLMGDIQVFEDIRLTAEVRDANKRS